MRRKIVSSEMLEPRVLLSTYDAATDFSTTQNPNGAWSYGVRSSETAAFTPFATATAIPLDFGSGAVGWDDNGGSPPYVGTNVTGAEYDSEGIRLPTGVLVMHPGANGEYSDTRFTIPQSGTVQVTFDFTGIDTNGTTTDVHVLDNGSSMKDGKINGYGAQYGSSFTLNNAVQGDTLDFIVGYGDNKTFFTDATSLSAQITTGASEAHLVISKQPKNSEVGAPIPMQVKIEDAKNHVLTKEPNGVNLALVDPSNQSDQASADVTVPFKHGVATFTAKNGPLINTPGSYTLTAVHVDAAGITTSATSDPFNVLAPHLVFTKQPATTAANEPIAFTVELENSKNKPVPGAGDEIELQTSDGDNGDIRSLTNGKYDNTKPTAGQTSLDIPEPGTYVVTAEQIDPSTGEPTSTPMITSNQFQVLGDHVVFKRQPSAVRINTPIPFEVVLEDEKNKPVTVPLGTSYDLVLSTNLESGNGPVPTQTSFPFSTGNFDNIVNGGQTPLEITSPGTYTITAEVIDGNSLVMVYQPVTSKVFKAK